MEGVKEVKHIEHSVMVDHCIVLLHHCADKGPIVNTMRGLAKECGIPHVTLKEILQSAYSDKLRSLLGEISVSGYPVFDFHVYRGVMTGEKQPRKLIDVVSRAY